jgi:hypothetical protein
MMHTGPARIAFGSGSPNKAEQPAAPSFAWGIRDRALLQHPAVSTEHGSGADGVIVKRLLKRLRLRKRRIPRQPRRLPWFSPLSTALWYTSDHLSTPSQRCSSHFPSSLSFDTNSGSARSTTPTRSPAATGGPLQIVAHIHDQVPIKSILDSLGLSPPEIGRPPSELR